MDEKLLVAEYLTYMTRKNWLGRAAFKPLRTLKRLPSPQEIIDVIVHDKQDISGVEVIAALKALCGVMKVVCPFVQKQPLVDNENTIN